MRKGVLFRFAFVMTLHEKILQDFFVLILHLGHCLVDQCSPGVIFLVRTVFRTAFIFGILIVIIMGRVRLHAFTGWDGCLIWTIFIFVPSKIIISSKYLSTVLTVHVCRSGSLQMTKRPVYSLISAKRICRTHRPHIDSTSTLHRPHIDLKSTSHRPHIDLTSTSQWPHIDLAKWKDLLRSTNFKTQSYRVWRAKEYPHVLVLQSMARMLRRFEKVSRNKRPVWKRCARTVWRSVWNQSPL